MEQLLTLFATDKIDSDEFQQIKDHLLSIRRESTDSTTSSSTSSEQGEPRKKTRRNSDGELNRIKGLPNGMQNRPGVLSDDDMSELRKGISICELLLRNPEQCESHIAQLFDADIPSHRLPKILNAFYKTALVMQWDERMLQYIRRSLIQARDGVKPSLVFTEAEKDLYIPLRELEKRIKNYTGKENVLEQLLCRFYVLEHPPRRTEFLHLRVFESEAPENFRGCYIVGNRVVLEQYKTASHNGPYTFELSDKFMTLLKKLKLEDGDRLWKFAQDEERRFYAFFSHSFQVITDIPFPNPSFLRKLYISEKYNSKISDEKKAVLAKQMAHSVSTAKEWYAKSNIREMREHYKKKMADVESEPVATKRKSGSHFAQEEDELLRKFYHETGGKFKKNADNEDLKSLLEGGRSSASLRQRAVVLGLSKRF